jgi:hypothetical protein
MDINIKAKIELIFKIKSKLSLTPTNSNPILNPYRARVSEA